MRGREQPIDQRFVGSFGTVGEKSGDLRGRGWQTSEVERESPDQAPPIRFGGRREALLLESLRHERIDRIARPARISDPRRLGTAQRPIRPMLARISLGPPSDR
jgi:hypothetical protein